MLCRRLPTNTNSARERGSARNLSRTDTPPPRGAGGVGALLLAPHPAEPLRPQPHVDRLKRHVDRQPVRDHGVASVSDAITSRSSAGSKPGWSSSVTPPTRNVIRLGTS